MVAVAAAIAVIGVMVGALVARQLGLSNVAQAADAGTVVVAPDPITMPPPDPQPFAPLEPAPAVVDAGQPEPKPNGKKLSPKKGSSKKAPDQAVDVVPVLTPEPAVAPSRGYGDLDWTQRVDELKKRSPSLGCSAPVAVHRDDYGRLEEAELRQWKTDLRACWDACKLPD